MHQPILLLAGDARLRALETLLKESGVAVRHLNALPPQDAPSSLFAQYATVVLPVPLTKDGVHLFASAAIEIPLADVFAACRAGQTVFGGGFTTAQSEALTAKGVRVVDLLQEEAYLWENAFLTAQGALRLLLENTSDALPGKSVLITGWGRVAKACAKLLLGLGCDVTVAARNGVQRTQAALCGVHTRTLAAALGPARFSFLLNTVPAPVFTEEMLRNTTPGAVYVELASAPFGADKDTVQRCGVHYLFGGALPGRFCPVGAAQAMLRQIQRIGGD